jgi:hypothetical protein
VGNPVNGLPEKHRCWLRLTKMQVVATSHDA